MNSRGTTTVVVSLLIVLLGVAAMTPRAEAFGFTIGVTGPGVTGSGSIDFPSDAGVDATGVDLVLNATLFGNAVAFTEADILTIGWSGATPGGPDLAVDNLSLALVGVTTLLLTDNGGGVGDAICTSALSVCDGENTAITTVAWTYTPPGGRPVPEASVTCAMIAGLGLLILRRARRRGSVPRP